MKHPSKKICAMGRRMESKRTFIECLCFRHSASVTTYNLLYYLDYLCEVGYIILMFTDDDTL